MLALANKLTISTQPIYRFVNKYSIDFDGVDDRIITDGADTVVQNTTYSFWCKSSTTVQNWGVFGHGSFKEGAFHFNQNANRPLLYLGSSYYVYWNDTPAQDDGEWHHWVVYLDTSSVTNCKLYIDGVLQTISASVNTPSDILPYTESLTIGSDQQVGGNSFEGKIDEFAVYDRELTQAEITRMFNTYYSPNRVANGNFSQIGNEEVTNGDFSQIGSEEVTNGDFATDSDWTKGAGTTISNNKLNINFSGAGNTAYQSLSLGSGVINKVVVVCSSYTSGSLDVRVGSNAVNSIVNSVGTFTFYIKEDGYPYINFFTGSGFIGSIDNVSVKEVGQDWSFLGDWTMGDNVATNTRNGSGFDPLTSSATIVVGKQYKFKCNIISKTGGTLLMHNDWTDSNYFSTSGTGEQVWYFTATSTTIGLEFAGDGETIVVDNISVKEVGQHWAAESGVTFQPIDGIATIISNGSFTGINQDTSINFGNTYRVTIEHKNTTADFRVYVGNQAFDTISTASDFTTSVVDIVAVGTSQTVFILPSQAAQTIQVKSIVVQELKHDATNLMLNAGAYQSANPLITSTKSMEFNVDDYLQLSEPVSYTNHTICGWAYSSNLSATDFIFSASDSASDGIRLSYRSSANFRYEVNGQNITSAPDTREANRWYFVCGTYDGTTARLYVDGIELASATASETISTTTNARIGNLSYTDGNFFDGKITEVGAFNRCLTALEVASLYNQGMPTNLLVNRNNYQSGNPTVFNTKQVDFDGTDDYMVANSTLGSFTGSVSAWVNRDSNSGYQFIIDFRNNSGVGWFYFDNDSDTIDSSSGTLYVDGVASTTLPTDGNWHHAVVTGMTIDITENIVFATIKDNSAWFFSGKMSQIGLWNSTLTADEVSSLYNHGLPIDLTTNQAAYESSSNLVGYWRMGSGTLDSYPLIADQTNATLTDIYASDFSSGVDGWTAFGLGDIAGNISIGGEDNSLRYTVTTPIGDTRAFLKSSTKTIGKTYKVTFSYYIPSTNPNLNAVYLDETDIRNSVLDTWTTVTEYFTASSVDTKIIVGDADMYLNPAATGETAYIKDVSVKQVNGNPAIMTNQTSSDIENGSPYANIVQNGTFDTDTDWTKGGGWSISNGELVGNNANGLTYQGISAKPNTSYKVTFTVSNYVSGNVLFQFNGGSNTGTPRTSVGTYTEYITTDASVNGNFSITRTQNFTGSVDNVTVEEVNTGLQGYWKMGDGTNDEYPVIYDQTNPTLSADISVWAGEDVNVSAYVGIESNTTTDLVVGKMYRLAFTVSNYISGSFRFRQPSGGVDLGVTGTANGDYVQYGIATNTAELDCDAFNLGFVGTIGNYSVQEVQGNPATMTNMVEGNITNQYPLTKIRNYYRMGDGILDGYPIIQDQTSPNLAHIPTTNLLQYSEDFSNAYWTKDRTTVVSGQLSPIGDTSAYKLVEDTSVGAHRISTSVIFVSAGITNTYSIHIKAAERTKVGIREERHAGKYATFNLLTKTIISNTGLTANIISLSNDWVRINFSQNSGGASEKFGFFLLNDSYTSGSPSSYSYTGDGTSGVFIYGAQLEEQSQATAYLESDGIAAERKSSTTNLVPYSEDFSQASQVQNVTLTANAITSPTGTSNGTKVLSSDNNSKVSYTNISFTNGTTYTLSVYCRNIDATALKLFIYNAGGGDITDDFTSQVNTTSWTRVSTTFTASQDTSSGQVQFARNLPSGESAYFWGFQLEEQTQAETYAKTTGLPVTIDLFTENNYGTMTNMSASDIVEDTP